MKKLMFRFLVGFIMTWIGYTIGCAIFGGTSIKPTAKPVAKLETDLELVKKEIDKSKKEIKEVGGNVSTFEQRISTMETTVNTFQTQINIIKTENTNYNESIKSIMWTIAGIWAGIKVLAFIQVLIAAWLMPGKTIKNVFTLPFGEKK